MKEDSNTVRATFNEWLDNYLANKKLDLSTFLVVHDVITDEIIAVHYKDIIDTIKYTFTIEDQLIIKSALITLEKYNHNIHSYLSWLGREIYISSEEHSY